MCACVCDVHTHSQTFPSSPLTWSESRYTRRATGKPSTHTPAATSHSPLEETQAPWRKGPAYRLGPAEYGRGLGRLGTPRNGRRALAAKVRFGKHTEASSRNPTAPVRGCKRPQKSHPRQKVIHADPPSRTGSAEPTS